MSSGPTFLLPQSLLLDDLESQAAAAALCERSTVQLCVLAAQGLLTLFTALGNVSYIRVIHNKGLIGLLYQNI